MKIIILGTAYPYRGGLAAFNERLALQYKKEGHEVEVWTFTLQYPSFLFPGKTQYSNSPCQDGLVVKRVLNSCHPLNWWKVGRAVKQAAPDLLICCYWMAFFAPCYGVVARIAKRNGKTRCVGLVHNMFPHEKNILDKLFAPYFVHSMDRFVALSDSVVNQIHTLTDAPAVASPHPIYDHYGEPMTKVEACEALGLEAQHNYLLFFGLVRAYKGLDLLLDAMKSVRAKHPQVRLLIAGEFYEDEAKYRAQIEANGITDCVVVRNEFVPDSDVRKYFSAADLIVQPYKSATQSGVTQIAYHFCKPMLVTNVGGLAEIVPNGKVGYVCEVDAESIAAAINDFLDKGNPDCFRAGIEKEKGKYAWEKMTAAINNL